MSAILTRQSRKHDQRDGWYEITPAQAAALLEHGAKNRPLKPGRAENICQEIAGGVWRPNGETVIFDDKGKMTDGQHRMRGCVLANTTIEVYCVFSIPDKYFPSLDQGVARGGGDLAALMDFKHYNLVSACSRLAMDYGDGLIGKTGSARLRPSSEAMRLYMKQHRDALAEASEIGMKFRKGIVNLIPMSQAVFVYYFTEQHAARRLEFIEKLSTGAGLHQGDALLLFRERMKELKGEKHTMLQHHKLALLIKAWNAFLSNKKIGLLRWKRDVEPFPRFE